MRVRETAPRCLVVALLGAVAFSACGGGGASERVGATVKPRVVAPAPPPALRPAPPPAPPPTAAPSPVDGLVGVGDARQVIAVIADDYGRTTATLTAYERDDAGWRAVFGPWDAQLGRSGFAPPGEKREGDGRTPSGAYGFDFAFGILDDPGVSLAYRRITGDAIVWDDDPASARYNLWTDTTREAAGADPEPMYNPPAYNYGAVIAYNTERTPGLGSAIFLHVSKGGPTAGCVAVAQERLLELLRWLDPVQRPRIVMGTRAAVSP